MIQTPDAGKSDRSIKAEELLRALDPAEEDVREGRVTEAREFFATFKRARGISD